MTTIISEKAIKDTDLSLDNAKQYGIATGTVVGGMLVAHVALKAIKKQDSLLVNGGLVVGGLVGAMKLQNPLLKMLCIGAASYGALKVANIAVKEVTAPGDSGAAGLSGLIPETVKAKIRSFLPTLGTVEGSEEQLLGDDDMAGIPNLDDMGTIDVPYVDVTNGTDGTVGSLL